MKKGIKALSAIMAVSFTMLSAGIVSAKDAKFGPESFFPGNPFATPEVIALLNSAAQGEANLFATQASISNVQQLQCNALATAVDAKKAIAEVTANYNAAQEVLKTATLSAKLNVPYSSLDTTEASKPKLKAEAAINVTGELITKADAEKLLSLLKVNAEMTKAAGATADLQTTYLTSASSAFSLGQTNAQLLAANVEAIQKSVANINSGKYQKTLADLTKAYGTREQAQATLLGFQNALQKANYELSVIKVLGEKLNHKWGPCLLDDSVAEAQAAQNTTITTKETATKGTKDAVPSTAAQLYYFSPAVPNVMTLEVYVIPAQKTETKVEYVGPLFTFDGLQNMALVEIVR